MPSNYELAAATLAVYRDEVAKSEKSAWSRRGLAADGSRVLAFAQVYATLAVVDALREKPEAAEDG